MFVTFDLPSEALRRLHAEAARRGISVDELIVELAESLPTASEPTPGRRHLAISGVGASGGNRGRARDADEMLAEGFGPD